MIDVSFSARAGNRITGRVSTPAPASHPTVILEINEGHGITTQSFELRLPAAFMSPADQVEFLHRLAVTAEELAEQITLPAEAVA